MPIASILPFQKPSTSSSLTDQAKELLVSIQTKFEQRNAVRYKVPSNLGHKFEQVILTAPTYCALCTDLIWGCFGQRCESCKLSSHRKCLSRINFRCATQTNIDNKSLFNHHLKPTTFWTPTYCGHCGTLIKGIYEQGLKCDCGLELHYDCKQFISWRCAKYQQVTQEKNSDSNEQDAKIWSKVCIDDFDLLSFLGCGSYGKIYLAQLKDSHREFAIKEVNKSNPIIGGDPKSVLTEKEVLILGRQSSFFPALHCCFQSRQKLYYVMDYIAGRDLLYHMRKARKFTEARARYHGAEIFLALDFLHSKKIIYRDLKLENVILNRNGHCKLLDFGMSKDLGKTVSQKTRTFCGTPSYMSPEMVQEQDYDYSTDWWSFGVLMFEMLAGFLPFEAGDEDSLCKSIVEDDVGVPRFLTIDASSLLDGLLIKDPSKRLGCQIIEDYTREISEHPFFRDHWNDRGQPPYIPSIEDLEPVGYNQDYINDTPSSSTDLVVDQSEFDGFDYYSESFKEHINDN